MAARRPRREPEASLVEWRDTTRGLRPPFGLLAESSPTIGTPSLRIVGDWAATAQTVAKTITARRLAIAVAVAPVHPRVYFGALVALLDLT